MIGILTRAQERERTQERSIWEWIQVRKVEVGECLVWKQWRDCERENRAGQGMNSSEKSSRKRIWWWKLLLRGERVKTLSDGAAGQKTFQSHWDFPKPWQTFETFQAGWVMVWKAGMTAGDTIRLKLRWYFFTFTFIKWKWKWTQFAYNSLLLLVKNIWKLIRFCKGLLSLPIDYKILIFLSNFLFGQNSWFTWGHQSIRVGVIIHLWQIDSVASLTPSI